MFGIKNRRKRSKKRDYSRLLSINLSRVDIVLMFLILLCMDKDMGGRAAIHCRATDIALSRFNLACWHCTALVMGSGGDKSYEKPTA